MNILTLGTSILAVGECTETPEEFVYPDAIFPKHVIEGYQVVDADLPEDYAPGKYLYDNGFVLAPPAPAAPVLAAESTGPTKEQLMSELAALTAKIQALE